MNFRNNIRLQEKNLGIRSHRELHSISVPLHLSQVGACEAQQIQAPSPPRPGEEGEAELTGGAGWSKAQQWEVICLLWDYPPLCLQKPN